MDSRVPAFSSAVSEPEVGMNVSSAFLTSDHGTVPHHVIVLLWYKGSLQASGLESRLLLWGHSSCGGGTLSTEADVQLG